MKKTTVIVIILCVAAAVIILGSLVLSKWMPAGSGSNAQTQSASNETKIMSKYLKLRYPAEISDVFIHEQDVYEGRVTDAFYMRNDQKDIPLFRIDFGDKEAGEWLGMLKTEDGDIYITTTVFKLADEEQTNMSEEALQLYTACMDAYSYMVEGIMSDPNFTVEKPLAIGENMDFKITHWNLTLPSNMIVEEANADGTYVATFYGEVAGESTKLYQVCIGENTTGFALGNYEVDGIQKPVWVNSSDFVEKPQWSEEDRLVAYRMMDTINDVIEQIMASEHFSLTDTE